MSAARLIKPCRSSAIFWHWKRRAAKKFSNILRRIGVWSSTKTGPTRPSSRCENHYGVRVTNNAEVDRATEYLERKKEEFGIKITKPRSNHNAEAMYRPIWSGLGW